MPPNPHPNPFEMVLALVLVDSEKNVFPDFFDMYFAKLMVLGQYLVSAPHPKEGDQYRFTRQMGTYLPDTQAFLRFQDVDRAVTLCPSSPHT